MVDQLSRAINLVCAHRLSSFFVRTFFFNCAPSAHRRAGEGHHQRKRERAREREKREEKGSTSLGLGATYVRFPEEELPVEIRDLRQDTDGERESGERRGEGSEGRRNVIGLGSEQRLKQFLPGEPSRQTEDMERAARTDWDEGGGHRGTSMVSMSITSRLRKPRRARSLRSSHPRPPAPITNTLIMLCSISFVSSPGQKLAPALGPANAP